MNSLTQRETLRSDRQIDYHANVCGRMTAMAVMQDLGGIRLSRPVGTPDDIRFFQLCELLADGKYQTFIESIDPVQSAHADTLQTTSNVVQRAGLGVDHDESGNRKNENAIEYLQGVRPKTKIGTKILEICDTQFIAHYQQMARANLEQALEQHVLSSTHGLGTPMQVGRIASAAEFYAGYYYRDATSV